MMAFVARPTLAATPFFLLPPHISRCGICLAATVATEVSLPPPTRMPPLAQMATLLSVYWLHVARLSEWTLRLPFALSVDVENIIGVAIVATSILRSVRRCSPPLLLRCRSLPLVAACRRLQLPPLARRSLP